MDFGWHYYLACLDSGFVYYGCTGTNASARSSRNPTPSKCGPHPRSHPRRRHNPPTVFLPQRHPWNPGGTNFGVQYGYKLTVDTNSDFWVWTYAYDVSGITNVTLFLRADGTNPPAADQFKTYAGGPLTGTWAGSNMTCRAVTPILGVTPQYIADYYYAKVSGITNAFVDYYVSASDSLGNVCKSPIQHVYVGSGTGAASGTGGGGPVSVSPPAPVAGYPVTIQYVATGRGLAPASQIYIHLGWNNWNPVVSPDAAMANNAASNTWQYTVTVPVSATQLNCVFNNGSGTWDNNGGANWNFAVTPNTTPQPPAQPQNLIATPVQTNQINLAWTASPGADAYLVNRNGSPIVMTPGTSYPDVGLSANTFCCYSIVASNSVGFSTPSATVCTNTPAAPPVIYPAFVMDGAFDSPGYLLASNGMVLYGALRGTTLYVATWSPGTNGPNDHFIFVSDQLLTAATTAAPWTKAGSIAVAAGKPYLASESQNGYISWYVNGAQTNWPCAKAPSSSGAMEGTLDLVAAFGSMPANLYLCAAAYQTANGGALAAQCPAGSGPNIDTNGFFVIPALALNDLNADGTFDRLDPALGFQWVNAQTVPGGFAMNWAAMPGHNYAVVYVNVLGNAWSNLAGGSNTAGPLQLFMAYTDTPPATVTQRFYRVILNR